MSKVDEVSKIDRRVATKNLRAKGFVEDKDGNDIFYRLKFNGKKTSVFTKVSHTKKMKDISGDLLTNIKKQLRLDKTKQAVDFLECLMSENEYIAILQSKNIISFDPKN